MVGARDVGLTGAASPEPSIAARRMRDRVFSIGTKLTLAISLVIALGFGSIVYFYTQQQEKNLLLQNERALNKVLDSVNQGLQTVMITASADAAQLYADKLKGVKDIDEIRILRPDGLEAFRDNATIRQVNEYRDTIEFTPRPTEEAIRVFAANHENFRRAIRSQQMVYYYDTQHDESHLTFLLPIKNIARCKRCHGRDEEVIGVLEVRSSLDSVKAEVRRTWLQSLLVLGVALATALVVAAAVLRRYIVRPIEVVSKAMSRVAAGDLDQRIPVLGRDELSSLALSFNSLTEELRTRHAGFNAEHNKLQTILMSTDEGIVVTDGAGNIVLVNPAAERLLDKPSAEIIGAGLPHLFDDPERIESALERDGIVSTADIFIFRRRHLAVYASTLRGGDGDMLGHAVLIRDMTEEKRLEQRLRELSNTDPLTGLSNRRALDEALNQEFGLALEQGRDLVVMMFDIDHFKKFNDTYGHDQGDRVLKDFATVALSCVREDLDIFCRFGGEEFTLIARETSQEGGLILAERIRLAVAAMTVDGLHVTTSIGVAGIRESGASAPMQLIERADAALYEAKRAGRNRVAAAVRSEA
jgi:diguanylate cyclase (GGDEF)-like protein/PAS domain S-box-containing protein